MLRSCIVAPLSIALFVGTAAAQEAYVVPSPDRWSVTALVGTDVGLDVGGGLQIETPFRLRLTGTAGWMPGLYAKALKHYYTDLFGGREPVGELLEEQLENAFVAHGTLGLRPFANRGLFIEATYSYVHSSKDGLIASLIEAAGGQGLSEGDEFQRTFESTAHAHMLGAMLGWQWGLWRGFSLRLAVGFSTIVKTSTSIEPNFTPRDPALNARIVTAAEAALEDAGVGIFAPVVSLYLGYTF